MTPITSVTPNQKRQSIRRTLGLVTIMSCAVLQVAGCATWLAQSEASFVERGNQICELETAQIQGKWKALLAKSPEVTSEEKQDFVRNIFIPNIRRQMRRIGDLQLGAPPFAAATKAELEAMVAAGDAALVTLENDPDLILAEDSAVTLFTPMEMSATALGLSKCTVEPLS